MIQLLDVHNDKSNDQFHAYFLFTKHKCPRDCGLNLANLYRHDVNRL